MRVRPLFIFGSAVLLLLLFGCLSRSNNEPLLGLTTKEGCDNRQPALRHSELIPCYHQAAITEAYMENNDVAVNTCTDIMTNIGSQHPNDDIGDKAETERNLCYFDIAKIIARQDGMGSYAENVCKNILDSGSSKLTGAVATQATCINETKRLASIQPQNYYSNPNNICSIMFVLPLIAAFAVFQKKN